MDLFPYHLHFLKEKIQLQVFSLAREIEHHQIGDIWVKWDDLQNSQFPVPSTFHLKRFYCQRVTSLKIYKQKECSQDLCWLVIRNQANLLLGEPGCRIGTLVSYVLFIPTPE